MYNLPTSCLVLLFFCSLFHTFPCSSSKEKNDVCEAQFHCGNITAGFPFSGRNRSKSCGHPLLELQCFNNSITSLSISDHLYHVLHIDQTSNTLTLARTDVLDSLCSSTFTNATLPPEIFDLSQNYKSFTIYYCFSNHRYLSKYPCPIAESKIPEYPESCHGSFTVNVPKSYVPEEKELTFTNLESVLREGFEVNVKIDVKACQECSSSHGFCGFNISLPSEVICRRFPQPTGLTSAAKLGISTTGMGLAILILSGLFCFIRRRMKTQEAQYTSKDLPIKSLFQLNLDPFILQPKLEALIPLKQYSYTQVKRITNSFADVVGRGGFGTVYRGKLCDGRMVAVKVLKESKDNNGEDFINEVASMSQTSHVNIVTLLGFCSEGSKRAILYEFMKNGSLDEFISSKRSLNMDSKELHGIALGVARGLEYLHHGCRTRIVHFDIKPQNVLLDDNLCPKVSDFGLAKLCERKESILSLLETRGTIGYIAPEVFSSVYGRVSHKSDVYSYGMLVLEMIGARNKTPTEHTASDTSSMYFPEWIYKDLEKEDNARLIKNGISIEEDEIAKKMTLVGLWCIQPWPSDRPAMSRVVEMMEGSVDVLELPPRPVLQCSVAPHLESSWISAESSIPSEI